jgi:hypothetical protein
LSSIASIVGFLGVGFVTNLIIGVAAYIALRFLCPKMRHVDQATVAGYHGPHAESGNGNDNGSKKPGLISGKLLLEVFLNTGLYLLFGGIIIGLISGLQGKAVTRDETVSSSRYFRACFAFSCSRWE